MKASRLLLFILFICFSTASKAQGIFVYSKIGHFYHLKNKQKVEIENNYQLSEKDIVITPSGGKLVLFDSVNKKEYEIRTNESTISIRKLLRDQEHTSFKNLTDIYYKWLCHQVMQNIDKIKGETIPTAVVRELDIIDDSLLVEPDDSLKYLP